MDTLSQNQKQMQYELQLELDLQDEKEYLQYDDLCKRTDMFREQFPGLMRENNDIYDFLCDFEEDKIYRNLHIPIMILDYIVDVLGIYYDEAEITRCMVQMFYNYILINTKVSKKYLRFYL